MWPGAEPLHHFNAVMVGFEARLLQATINAVYRQGGIEMRCHPNLWGNFAHGQDLLPQPSLVRQSLP